MVEKITKTQNPPCFDEFISTRTPSFRSVAIATAMAGVDGRFDLGVPPPLPLGDPRYAEALRDTQRRVISDSSDAVEDAPTTLKDVNAEFRETQLFARAIAQARHDDAVAAGHAASPAGSGSIPFAVVTTTDPTGAVDAGRFDHLSSSFSAGYPHCYDAHGQQQQLSLIHI